MVKTVAVVVSAGSGKRMGAKVSKQYLKVCGKPIVVHALEALNRTPAVDAIVLVVGANDVDFGQDLVRRFAIHKVSAVVPGGGERQQSVSLGLEALMGRHPEAEWVLIHDGARPLVTPELAERCLQAAKQAGAAVPAVPVKDTIKVADRDRVIVATPERESLWSVQTPQAFRVDLLWDAHRRALEDGFIGTDDASLVERLGAKVLIAEGDYRNLKVTTPEDLGVVKRLLQEGEEEERMIRVGHGFDVHRFADDRKCIIGGVEIPFEKGLLGHSDADVLLHALTDAILGALAMGDIGKHFPDTDPKYKDADSLVLLKEVWKLVRERGYTLGNADCTVMAQRPKMAPHIPAIVRTIAEALGTDESRVNVKATTTESLGFVGREEGIAAQAVVSLIYQSETV